MPTPSSISLDQRFPVGTRVRITTDVRDTFLFGTVVPHDRMPRLDHDAQQYDSIGGVYVISTLSGPRRLVAIERDDNGCIYGYLPPRLTALPGLLPEPATPSAEHDARVMAKHILRPSATEHIPEHVLAAAERVVGPDDAFGPTLTITRVGKPSERDYVEPQVKALERMRRHLDSRVAPEVWKYNPPFTEAVEVAGTGCGEGFYTAVKDGTMRVYSNDTGANLAVGTVPPGTRVSIDSPAILAWTLNRRNREALTRIRNAKASV